MKILGNLLRRLVSKKSEKGEYSAGYWPLKVRTKLVDLAPKTGTYLEVGCGEGLFLKDLRNSKPLLLLTGVDNWEEILNKSKERFKGDEKVKLLLSSGEKLPFADSSFDSASAVNLLINIKEKETVNSIIRELLRVVKPSGSIFFDIRNKRSPFLSLQYGLAKFYDPDIKVPLMRYNEEEFDVLIGGKVARKSHYLTFFGRGNRFSPIIIIEIVKK